MGLAQAAWRAAGRAGRGSNSAMESARPPAARIPLRRLVSYDVTPAETEFGGIELASCAVMAQVRTACQGIREWDLVPASGICALEVISCCAAARVAARPQISDSCMRCHPNRFPEMS